MINTVNRYSSALLFVPNEGQFEERTRFIAHTQGQTFCFTQSGIATVFHSRAQNETSEKADAAALILSFLEATPVTPEGLYQAEGQFHYFIGNDTAKWRTHLPGYQTLRYENLYEGVDLVLCGSEYSLKFLWSLKEARNISAIRVRYEGAEEIRISEDGNLIIRHALGELIDPAPVAWQEIDEKNVPVVCAYAVDGDIVSFVLYGAYDADAPLFIDPVLPYSTYLGGSGADYGYAVATDYEGCAYVAGTTASSNFPVTPGAYNTTYSGTQMAFLTKLSADGTSLVYSTFLGGDVGETGCNSIALDSELCAYLTGYTTSASFPVTPGAFQTVHGGGARDAFVTKFSPDGARLVYSTFLGGSGDDVSNGIYVDAQGCAYVAGYTMSANFPTTPGAYRPTRGGWQDAFLTKVSTDGASLVYSTYFGGSIANWANSVAVDALGCAYMTGGTRSMDLPVTAGAFQPNFGGGGSDAFVTRFSPIGASLSYSTYLGGNQDDVGQSIAVDARRCAVIAGYTNSSDFPVTPGAFQPVYGGGTTTFVTKLSPGGGALVASTYLGGSGYGVVQSLALSPNGSIIVTGITDSYDFPLTPEVIPSRLNGDSDAFVSMLSSALDRLLVSFYLGGDGDDAGRGIAVGADGAVYMTGYTDSTDFPVTSDAFQSAKGGLMDAFVKKIGFVQLRMASVELQGLL